MSTLRDSSTGAQAIPYQSEANAPAPSWAPDGPANQDHSEGDPVVSAKRKPAAEASETESPSKRFKRKAVNAKHQKNDGQRKPSTPAFEELIQYKIKYECLIDMLSMTFTKYQIGRLHDHNCDDKLSAEDFVQALLIQKEGYNYMVTKSKLERIFPHISEVDKWVSDFDIKEGIQSNLMPFIEYQLTSLDYSKAEKLTVLVIRDIPLFPQYELDDLNEEVYGRKRCQFVVARGLKGKWTQLVYYKYDEPMERRDIMELLNTLHRIGLSVVAISCEVDSDWSRELLTNLGISPGLEAKSSFQHPRDPSINVHIFYDSLQLMVKARNHFVTHGWNYDGKMLTTNTLSKMMMNNKSGSSDDLKLKPYHIEVGSKGDKIESITELFSTKTVKAITIYSMTELDNDHWLEFKFMIETFSKWIKMQSKTITALLLAKNLVFAQIKHFFDKLKAPSDNKAVENNLSQIREGIVTTNKSLLNIHTELSKRFPKDFKNVQAERLNRDGLSEFLSPLAGSTFTAVAFKRRLREYWLFAKREEKSAGNNKDRILTEALNIVMERVTQSFVDHPPLFSVLVNGEVCPSTLNADFDDNDLKYLAGYVASKFIDKYPNIGDKMKLLEPQQGSVEWVHMLCKQKAIEPCDYLIDLVKKTANVTEVSNKFGAKVITKITEIVHPRIINMIPDYQFDKSVTYFTVKAWAYIRTRKTNQYIYFLDS